jgi:hypothetical protein
MNERIRQLAEQAEKYADDNFKDEPTYSEAYDSKFAELIVEECCHRLGEETIRHDGYGYNQHELYNRLRKHFGIEE